MGMSEPAIAAPSFSFYEDEKLKIPQSERKLSRWGSVREAARILDECDREVIYDLIATRQVRGYKRRPLRNNSHWRVDLLSVWEHKQRQMIA